MDITMCAGTSCPMKHSCYRFTAPENDLRQSYFVVVPLERPLQGDHASMVVCKEFVNNPK